MDKSTKIKKVIITGVTGQDGSYMAKYLLHKTHINEVLGGNEITFEIYGTIRRLSVNNHENIECLKTNKNFHLVEMDLCDSESVDRVIREIKPDYFINFAANSFVGTSWKMPVNHLTSNTMAVLHQLESIRRHCPNCRYYNAGSSEEFGNVSYIPQDEKHPLNPRSPYGASKAAARHIVKVWRESYCLYAIQGFLFNHESPNRGHEFVTRKVTLGVAKIRKAISTGAPFEPIELGNLDAKRDWSHALDFVDGVWLMLNQNFTDRKNIPTEIKEYVLSSNETHTIRELVEKAFSAAHINGKWIGSGLCEKYVLSDNESIELVKVNEAFYRPAEVDILLGDSTKAREELSWFPAYTFDSLVEEMVKSDIEKEKKLHQ